MPGEFESTSSDVVINFTMGRAYIADCVWQEIMYAGFWMLSCGSEWEGVNVKERELS